MSNLETVVYYLRRIEGRVRCLSQDDVFSGNNPKSYVRGQSSFARTETRRLAKVLKKINPNLPDFEWTKRK